MDAFWTALFPALASVMSAGISAYVLVRMNTVSASVAAVATSVTTVQADVGTVRTDVEHVKVATNSMKDQLVKMAHAEGKQEGKDEADAAAAQTALDVEAGRELERELTKELEPAKSAGDAIREAIPVTVIDESVPVHEKPPTDKKPGEKP